MPGIAGASGGTGLLVLAGLIPDEYHALRIFATYASPAATVAISAIWLWASRYLDAWSRRLGIDEALHASRSLRDEIMRDAHSSLEHKKRAQENVEKLERLAMDVINDDAQLVRTNLTPEPNALD